MSFARYPAYKDSGVAWLGEVPGHWEVWKLAQGCESIGSGTTPKTENILYYEGGEIPWVNTGDLNDSDLLDCNKQITELAMAQHSTLKLFPEDAVVIAMYGATIGKLAILKFRATVNQACCVFSGNGAIDKKFLFFWLMGFREQIVGLATGGGQPNISQEILRSLKLACPELAEQQAIATFLDTETAKIDGLMAEQRALVALLKEKRQAVISHAVTKGLNPAAPMKDSGVAWLGEVPGHWNVTKAGRFLSILSGFAFPSSGFSIDESNTKLLRGINVGVSEIKWDQTVYWPRTEADDLGAFELSAGDIVIGMDRPWISEGVRVARISEKDLPCLLLQRVAALSTFEKLNSDYLFELLSSQIFVNYFSPDTTGVSVPHISPSQISEFLIPIPPIAEQQAIVALINHQTTQLDTLIQEAQTAIVLLQERRTALISAVVTGKMDVRAAMTA